MHSLAPYQLAREKSRGVRLVTAVSPPDALVIFARALHPGSRLEIMPTLSFQGFGSGF